MSKIEQELEKRLDENKYELLKSFKELLEEVRLFIEGEDCGHTVETCYCSTCDRVERGDAVLAKIEGEKK